MIFKWKPDPPSPKANDVRTCEGFVVWKTIGDETRAVMRTKWMERYEVMSGFGAFAMERGVWVPFAWCNNE